MSSAGGAVCRVLGQATRHRVMLGVLLAWVACQAALARPDSIVADWNGWRQADTQAIALHFAAGPFDPLRPRVDWGGDDPGFVEAELQLYTWPIALLLRVFGPVEWPGQLLSLLFVAVAALALYRTLASRLGRGPALAGAGLVLATRSAVFVSTAVQPDALGLMATVLGLVAFLRFMDDGRGRDLAVAAVWTAAAGLVKPTNLGLGLTEVALVVALRPRWLLRARLWVAWGAVLAAVGTHLAWGAHLHAEWGHTFGVVSGGDAKTPGLDQLLRLGRYWDVARVSLVWGVGPLGAMSAAWLVLRRRVDAVAVALALGHGAALIVALRYASQDWLGSHYHVPGALLGAWLLARAVADPALVGRRAARLATLVVVGLLLVAQYAWSLQARRTLGRDWADPEIALAAALAPHVGAGDRVVVRSRVASRDESWGTVNNHEDPRVFYLARTRGWVVAADRWEVAAVADAAARGARFYADPTGELEGHPDLLAWLQAHGRRMSAPPGQHLYELTPGGAVR